MHHTGMSIMHTILLNPSPRRWIVHNDATSHSKAQNTKRLKTPAGDPNQLMLRWR